MFSQIPHSQFHILQLFCSASLRLAGWPSCARDATPQGGAFGDRAGCRCQMAILPGVIKVTNGYSITWHYGLETPHKLGYEPYNYGDIYPLILDLFRSEELAHPMADLLGFSAWQGV